jgi:DNA-binding NarL/FixJ family response regulator
MAGRCSLAPPNDASRVDLGRAPSDLEAFSFIVDADEYVVLTFRPAESPGILRAHAGLTDGEKGVVELVVQGWSHSRIATERGTSPRTVANQLGAAYRKLGVKSRRELIARNRLPEPR